MKKQIIALLSAGLFAFAGTASATSSLGGYGELHYNNITSKDKDGNSTGTKKEIDFHRYVLFFNHEFDESTRFFSELELEHSLAGEGKPGEIELEQAYIELDLNQNNRFKAGLFLIPVGILNETHEPATFYGVERNPIEKAIIPTTWWESGLGFSGEFGEGFSYDTLLHSGLYNKSTNSVTIRSGRQKSAKAKANSFAATARIKYTGIKGLELAATVQHQGDVSQSQLNPTISNSISANLVEAHAIYTTGGLKLTALTAQWSVDDSKDKTYTAVTSQNGSYVEASYKFTPKFGSFVRYNQWSTKKKVNDNQIDLGVNYWPHERVVFKFDVFKGEKDNDGTKSSKEGANLGVGYQF